MYQEPRLLAAGESGWVVEFSDRVELAANAATRLLDASLPAAVARRGWPAAALTGTVPTYRSLLVLFDPLRTPAGEWPGLLLDLARAAQEGASDPRRDPAHGDGRLIHIPVCYEGDLAPDLPAVADLTGLTAEQVIQHHTTPEYLVHMMGFQIGYPYMASLPPVLRLPRLAQPRLKTPVGAVAIAGELTGIYSLPSPGGWRVLGTTPLRMWDLAWDSPTLLMAGDRVRFDPVDRSTFDRIRQSETRESGAHRAGGDDGDSRISRDDEPLAGARPALQVLSPGLLTTVQDLGRQGYQRFGLGPGGAMDKFALRVGNRLLGNAEGAAALEVTGGGARWRVHCDINLAWTGAEADLRVDGRQVPTWTVFAAKAGQVLECGSPRRGFRGYLCVGGGGCAVPLVLGSRSTNLAAAFGGLGGRACRPGDMILTWDDGGPAAAPLAGCQGSARTIEGRSARAEVIDAVYGNLGADRVELSLVPGPQDDYFAEEAWVGLARADYRISGDSNRMGYRLEGPPVRAAGGHDIVSDGLCEGAVQVPGNGQPLLLMADHQTTGGYPKIGVLAAHALPLAAQLAPGCRVGFRIVDVSAARDLRLRLEHAIAEAAGQLSRWQLDVGGRRYQIEIDAVDVPGPISRR